MSFLKYLIYIVLAIVLYIVAKGFYDGSITGSTTVDEVGAKINSETRNMAETATDAVEKSMDNVKQTRQRQ